MRRQGVAVRRQEPKAVERLVGVRVARSVPLKGPPQEANLQRKRLRTPVPKGAASELKKCTWRAPGEFHLSVLCEPRAHISKAIAGGLGGVDRDEGGLQGAGLLV